MFLKNSLFVGLLLFLLDICCSQCAELTATDELSLELWGELSNTDISVFTSCNWLLLSFGCIIIPSLVFFDFSFFSRLACFTVCAKCSVSLLTIATSVRSRLLWMARSYASRSFSKPQVNRGRYLMFQISEYHGLRCLPPTWVLFNVTAISRAIRLLANSTHPSVKIRFFLDSNDFDPDPNNKHSNLTLLICYITVLFYCCAD